MNEITCHGWAASGLHSWLAAIGAVHLDRALRLHWTDEAEPVAVLSCGDGDPTERLAEAWPTGESLKSLPVAPEWKDPNSIMRTGSSGRKISVRDFQIRAGEARGHKDVWSLSSTMTDLHVDDKGEVAHAPLDPSGPGTIGCLHERLVKVHRTTVHGTTVKKPFDLSASISGFPKLVQDNGLGFNISRIGSLADSYEKMVDPVVEVLAFFGLSIFPVRGDGVEGAVAKRKEPRQRGWVKAKNGQKNTVIRWPAWLHSLGIDAIDALLDVWRPCDGLSWAALGIHAAWESVSYRSRAKNDPTKGFGSRRMKRR